MTEPPSSSADTCVSDLITEVDEETGVVTRRSASLTTSASVVSGKAKGAKNDDLPSPPPPYEVGIDYFFNTVY